MHTRSQNQAQSNSYNLRIFLLMGLITVFIFFIILRLYNIQIISHSSYFAQAANQHGSQSMIEPKRGQIYLSAGNQKQPVLAATNISMNLVYAIGKQMTDNEKKQAADKLESVLHIPRVEILNKLSSGNQSYLPLKHELTEAESKTIENLNLKGIKLEPEIVRYYPDKNLASQVLGFLGYKGNDRVGQYGIEGEFEEQLAGHAGVVSLAPNIAKTLLSLGSTGDTPAHDGSDIYLTIDPAIQFKAQQVLNQSVKQHNADFGSVVVVNPKSGQVMAMVNSPDFDPNDYNKVSSASVYNNGAISSDYEPGSVFKAITMAIGIDQGKVSPQSTYNDTGELVFDQFKIKNSDGKAHGIQTMTQVLDESLNTGAAFVEQQVGQSVFRDYVKKFGFGKLVGVDLPGEVKGNIENLNSKGDVFFATASFGQGLTATEVQLIQAYTAFANGGKMMKPYVVDKIVHPDGSVDQKGPEQIGQIIDSKTASTMSAMLVDVVENGHGKRAAVKGYYIGGKTGTAQVANVGRSGYDTNKTIGSFIGYGPVDNPAFLMLVRIDNPKDVTFAESSAAPVFGELASFILNYLQVPPSR